MDGRGRALDNIFVERLWHSVKYEEVYLHDYEGVPQAITGLGKYFNFYHRCLDNGVHLSHGSDTLFPATIAIEINFRSNK